MKLAEILEKHLVGVLAALLALYGGYLTGMQNMTNEIATMNDKLAEIKGNVADLKKTSEANTGRLMRLECQSKIGECK